MVFATQNPVDFEGTFRLPDSQLDRFLVCLDMGYPAFADELDILASPLSHYDALQFDALFDGAEVLQWQALVDNIHCEPAVLEYLLRLVTATRTDTALRTGISPRGAIAIKRCAQAHGLYRGRAFVIPEDIAAVFTAVSAHRVVLARHGSDPMDDKRRIEAMLLHLLETIPLPV
jgi:MoxR-like ATPase